MLKKNRLPITLLLLITGLLLVLVTSCLGDVNNDVSPTEAGVQTSQPEILEIEIVDEQSFQRYVSGEDVQIHAVQGEGHNSLLTRKAVEFLTGVVTVKRADGFYMQSLQPDENELTSEGVFVYLNKPPKLEIGDLIYVNGTVTEFYPGGMETGNLSITQIENAEYSVISRNNPLPLPVILGEGGRTLPTKVIDDDGKQIFQMTDGLDFFESVEGMLVQINDAIVVAPTTAYKEIAVLPDFGKAATGLNERGGITISAEDF